MKIHTVELKPGAPELHEVVLHSEHLQALARVEAERDRFRAVLEGAEYGNIEDIPKFSIEQCQWLGRTVGDMTKSALADRNLLSDQCQAYVRTGNEVLAERDTAQAQLAEAVGLLRYSQEIARLFDEEHTAEVGRFLARHAQAEQQEAQSPMAKIAEGLRQKSADEWANHPSNPANQEAQGAQAGDERTAFEEAWINLYRIDVEKCPEFHPKTFRTGTSYQREVGGDYIGSAWWGWQARAALATQPAVSVSAEAMSFEYAHISGERRTVSITREDVIEGMEDALYEKLSDQICRCEPIGETNVVECNCQDYVEEFALVAAKPAVRGAEHDQ